MSLKWTPKKVRADWGGGYGDIYGGAPYGPDPYVIGKAEETPVDVKAAAEQLEETARGFVRGAVTAPLYIPGLVMKGLEGYAQLGRLAVGAYDDIETAAEYSPGDMMNRAVRGAAEELIPHSSAYDFARKDLVNADIGGEILGTVASPTLYKGAGKVLSRIPKGSKAGAVSTEFLGVEPKTAVKVPPKQTPTGVTARTGADLETSIPPKVQPSPTAGVRLTESEVKYLTPKTSAPAPTGADYVAPPPKQPVVANGELVPARATKPLPANANMSAAAKRAYKAASHDARLTARAAREASEMEAAEAQAQAQAKMAEDIAKWDEAAAAHNQRAADIQYAFDRDMPLNQVPMDRNGLRVGFKNEYLRDARSAATSQAMRDELVEAFTRDMMSEGTAPLAGDQLEFPMFDSASLSSPKSSASMFEHVARENDLAHAFGEVGELTPAMTKVIAEGEAAAARAPMVSQPQVFRPVLDATKDALLGDVPLPTLRGAWGAVSDGGKFVWNHGRAAGRAARWTMEGGALVGATANLVTGRDAQYDAERAKEVARLTSEYNDRLSKAKTPQAQAEAKVAFQKGLANLSSPEGEAKLAASARGQIMKDTLMPARRLVGYGPESRKASAEAVTAAAQSQIESLGRPAVASVAAPSAPASQSQPTGLAALAESDPERYEAYVIGALKNKVGAAQNALRAMYARSGKAPGRQMQELLEADPDTIDLTKPGVRNALFGFRDLNDTETVSRIIGAGRAR